MRFAKASALACMAVLLLGGIARADVVEVGAQAGVAQGDVRTFSVAPLNRVVGDGDEDYASYNDDALNDFFLVRHTPDEGVVGIPPSNLYRGTPTGFVETADSFKKSNQDTDKHGCDWGDADLDGDLDMFCAIGLTQTSKNELWIQNATGGFTERSLEMGLRDEFHGRYRYATFIHANGDSRPDIYVARYTGSCKCDNNEDGVIDYLGDSFPNELWINTDSGAKTTANPTGTKFILDASTEADPDGQYNLTKTLSAKKDNATCMQNVDFDFDGDEDLLFCGGNRLKLFRNDFDGGAGLGFTDISSTRGISGDAQDARLVFLDDDNFYDLVRLNKGSLVVKYDRGAPGTLGPVQTLVGTLTAGEALSFGRFDEDNSLDIYQLSSRARFKKDQADRILRNTALGWDITVLPQVVPGAGDDVGAVDYNNDGSDEFLVTNGDRKIAGPVQLFDWAPGGGLPE